MTRISKRRRLAHKYRPFCRPSAPSFLAKGTYGCVYRYKRTRVLKKVRLP